jgi:hypothetical protein
MRGPRRSPRWARRSTSSARYGTDPRAAGCFSTASSITFTAPPGSAAEVEGLVSQVAPWVAIRAVGGAVNDGGPAATAYAHRHENFNISSVGSAEAKFRRHWDELRPRLDGLYLSFETDDRPARLSDAFPGPALARLRRLQAAYDPADVFNANFPIPPARFAADKGVHPDSDVA